MKEKIEKKISEIVDYVMSKKVEEIELDDYIILANELKEIHFMESENNSRERMEKLLSMVATPIPSIFGNVN